MRNSPTATGTATETWSPNQTANQQLVKATELKVYKPSLANTPTHVGKKYSYLQEKYDTSCLRETT